MSALVSEIVSVSNRMIPDVVTAKRNQKKIPKLGRGTIMNISNDKFDMLVSTTTSMQHIKSYVIFPKVSIEKDELVSFRGRR